MTPRRSIRTLASVAALFAGLVLHAGVWAIGAVAEAQIADEGREYALPLTFEYGLRDDLEILIEPVRSEERRVGKECA